MRRRPRGSRHVADAWRAGHSAGIGHVQHQNPSLHTAPASNMRLPCATSSILLSLLCMARALHIHECSPWDGGRQICVDARLYEDGTIAAEITNESTQLFHGCRGGVVLIGSDDAGHVLWKSEMDGRTAGGLTDPFCRSFQRLAATAKVDGTAASQTTSVQVLYDFRDLSPRRRFPEIYEKLVEQL